MLLAVRVEHPEDREEHPADRMEPQVPRAAHFAALRALSVPAEAETVAGLAGQ
jgi:hypothetical protein